MTDAPGASGAVWPRPLRRSPPEQAQATGKWRDNMRRGGSGASQSERTTGEAGISSAGSRRAQRQNEFESGIQGTPQTRLLRERQTEGDSVSICPEAGSFPQASCDFGEFSVNQPLYFSGARS